MSDLTQVGPTLYLSKAVQIDAYVNQSNEASAIVDFLSDTTVTIQKSPLVGTDAVNKDYVDTQISSLSTTTVAGLTSGLAAEITRAEAAEGVLASGLAAEITRAELAEDVLRDALDDEVARAQAAEGVLTNALAAEISSREVSDASMNATTIRNTRIMPMDATVYADAEKPTAKDLVQGLAPVSLNYDGWYFRNNVAGNKINWYVATNPNTTLGDIKSLMLDHLVIKKASTLFITFYTERSGAPGEVLPEGGAGWYKSRMTYIVKDNSVLTETQPYRFLAKLDPNAHDIVGPDNHPIIELTLADNSIYKDANKNSVNLPTDKIKFFAISSNSASSPGEVESIVKGFSFQTVDGVYNHLFSDESVALKFYSEKVQALYTYFFQKNITGDDSAFVPIA